MQLRSIIIFLISFSYGLVSAQNSISFYANTELSNLLEIAQRQNKNIFVDTYAKWCKPCKKQSKSFMDSEVAAYFNSNFINVKYDMDTEIGKAVDLKYGVVFLPTILILDKYGNIRIKVDTGVLSPKELLNIAKAVTEPYVNKPVVSSAPPPVSVPKEKEIIVESKPVESAVPKTEPAEKHTLTSPEATDEKILLVLDGDTELPPEILLKEAYFRMQLMDGTHRDAANKYLATQEDWSTEENIKFIHDFLHTTRSDEFKYLVENREKFNVHVGEKNVNNTIEHLVYNTLYNGYPRPTLEKAIELFGFIDPHNNTVNGYRYFLTRLHDEENKEKYIEFAERYLSKRNKKDHSEMLRLSEVLSLKEPNKDDLKDSEKWINKAIKEEDANSTYYAQLARVKSLRGKSDQAIEAIQKSILLAEKQEKETEHLLEFLEELSNQ